MAKNVVSVNKLIFHRTSDVIMAPFVSPSILSSMTSYFNDLFTTSVNGYKRSEYRDGNPVPTDYSETVLISETNTLNLHTILWDMSVNEECYLYRENIGDAIRLVFRRVAGNQMEVLSYFYGTYTSLFTTTFISQMYDTGSEIVPAKMFVGFGYDDDTTRWVFYVTKCYGYRVEPWNQTNYYIQGQWSVAASTIVNALLSGNVPTPPSGDPYEEGGTSTPGGGEGSFDDSSDTISVPSAPLLNLTTSKMLNAYVISVQDLNDLADYLWGNFDKTDSSKVLSKIFADPTDAILGLFMLPFTPSSSSAIPVTVGGYLAGSLEFSPLSAQFKDVDCGSVTFEEYWGNYLDYNPYTRLTLFLPGVGEVQLDPDEVMGKTVSVKYRVDCLTGQFVAFVYGDGKIFAQYQGVCSLQVPVSSADYSRLNTAVMQAATMAAGVAVGVSSGGGMAALAEGADALPSTALNLLNSKVNHSHSGSLTGASFFMGSQKPYVIIHRARQSVPEGANAYYGYPSNVRAVLGQLSGFTKVKDIILDGLPLTAAELSELRGILTAGIYV